MRPLLLVLAITIPCAAIIVACVGDDPTSTPAPSDDGGNGQDTSSGGTDGATPPPPPAADGGPDTGSDAATPPLDVRTIPGLRLWLESSKSLTMGAGIGFDQWKDSSDRWLDGGAGAPDGGVHTAVLSNTGSAPTVVVNGFAGRPTVSFTQGNGDIRVANHPDFGFGTGDFAVVLVTKTTVGSGDTFRFMKLNSAPTGVELTAGSLCIGYSAAGSRCTAPVVVPSADPHVFAGRRKGGQLTFRVDGTVGGTYDFADNPDLSVLDFQNPYLYIAGAAATAANTMDVSELVIVIGPTSDADLGALESHLKAKYLIP